MLDAKTQRAKGLRLLQRIDDLRRCVVTGEQIGGAVHPRSYSESVAKPRKEAGSSRTVCRIYWTTMSSIYGIWEQQ